MSGILAAIACGFLGMAVGAALQRWGDGVKASEHLGLRETRHLDVDMDETEYAAWSTTPWTRENR